jgi:hypothetical protein
VSITLLLLAYLLQAIQSLSAIFMEKQTLLPLPIQYKAQEVQVVGVFLMGVQVLQQLQVDLLASQDQA